MHLSEQFTFGLRLSIQLKTKALGGGMGVGNEGGSSVCVKFGTENESLTWRGVCVCHFKHVCNVVLLEEVLFFCPV